MRKSRVVSLAAAALLAVVPATFYAVNSMPAKMVLADKFNNQKDGSEPTEENAEQIIYKNTASADKQDADGRIRISVHPKNVNPQNPDSDQITDEDVENYYEKSSHVYIDGTDYTPGKDILHGNLQDDEYLPLNDPQNQRINNELKNNADYQGEGSGSSIENTTDFKENDDETPTKLKAGDKVDTWINLPPLTPNKWYQWSTDEDVDKIMKEANDKLAAEGGLPKEITDNIRYTYDPIKKVGKVFARTTIYGDFRSLADYDLNSTDNNVIILPTDNILPTGKFVISSDKDAVQIDHDGIKGERTEIESVPDQNVSVDNSGEVNDLVPEDQDSNDKPGSGVPNPGLQPDGSSNRTLELMYSSNAIVYVKKGDKVVPDKIADMYLFESKYHKLNALDNGKIYTFNGEHYYRIDDVGHYVKVANTVKKPNENVRVKGRKNKKILNFYTEKGQYAHKFTTSKKPIKFSQSKFINNYLYYKVSGKKLWVRAKDINLIK